MHAILLYLDPECLVLEQHPPFKRHTFALELLIILLILYTISLGLKLHAVKYLKVSGTGVKKYEDFKKTVVCPACRSRCTHHPPPQLGEYWPSYCLMLKGLFS